MRWVFFLGVGAFVAFPWACGGKAVVDATGAGGAANSTGAGDPGAGGDVVVQAQMNASVANTTSAPPPVCELRSDEDQCNDCATDFCIFELGECCEATGCIELVECIIDHCQGVQDQTACAVQECPEEVSQGSGSIAEAQQLGNCLSACGCG